jgi:nudix motif 8
MKPFTTQSLRRVQDALRSFENTVAHDRVLPPTSRSVLDYEERMRRKAAVLVPLVNVDGAASILFTVRAATLNTHKAQVSFPGGHVDEGETVEQAAIRELKEETDLDVIQILGQYSSARAYTGTMVTPVVGFVGNLTRAQVERSGTLRPEEVSAAFHLPVDHLAGLDNRHVEVLTHFRTFRFLGGPEPIWGLTGFFLEGLLRQVLAPSLDLPFPPTQTKTQHL